MDARIKSVMRFPNGMVMVFDQQGRQLAEYQGVYEDMRVKILNAKPESVAVEEMPWTPDEIRDGLRLRKVVH